MNGTKKTSLSLLVSKFHRNAAFPQRIRQSAATAVSFKRKTTTKKSQQHHQQNARHFDQSKTKITLNIHSYSDNHNKYIPNTQ